MLSNETLISSPPMLIISFAISTAVFLIIGIWKTRSGVFRDQTRVLYPGDCMADLMSELAEHKEILGKEMEKKIQDAEMKRISALAESVKKGREVTKKTNQMRKLEEERNQAREDARQRRRDVDWLFSKRRNGAQVSLAPELRWPSFPEISASSSTRADPKLPAESTTERPAASFSSVQNTRGTVAQGVFPEMPTPSYPPPSPNQAEEAELVSPGGFPLSSTNTNNSKTPTASISNHKDPSKKPLKVNSPTNTLKGRNVPPPPVPPRGSRNGTSAPVPKNCATYLNSKQTPGPGKKF